MWGHLFDARFPISVGFMIAPFQQDPTAQTRHHLLAYLGTEIERLVALKALNPALREEEIAGLKTRDTAYRRVAPHPQPPGARPSAARLCPARPGRRKKRSEYPYRPEPGNDADGRVRH